MSIDSYFHDLGMMRPSCFSTIAWRPDVALLEGEKLVDFAKTGAETGWRHLPLCATYLLVLFETRPVRVNQDGVICDQAVRWALGTLADGECEVLGVWPGAISGPDDWREAIDDLKARGVQRIRFAGGDEPIGVSIAFPSAVVLPLIGQALRRSLATVESRDRTRAVDELISAQVAGTREATHIALASLAVSSCGAKHSTILESWHCELERLAPLFPLSPRLRRIIRSGDAEVHRLDGALTRAVKRQGSFIDQAAVVSILGDVLERAARKRGGHGSGAARRPQSNIRTAGFGATALGL